LNSLVRIAVVRLSLTLPSPAGRGSGLAGLVIPKFAEEGAATEVNAFAEVGGGVLFEGVVEVLDGATPRTREGWRCGFWRWGFHIGGVLNVEF
jgi:hypothetical protein